MCKELIYLRFLFLQGGLIVNCLKVCVLNFLVAFITLIHACSSTVSMKANLKNMDSPSIYYTIHQKTKTNGKKHPRGCVQLSRNRLKNA